MLLRDTTAKNLRSPALGDTFSSDELERLAALRRDYTEHAEHSEFLMDPAQLEFARWLYANGRIGEHSVKRV